MTPEATERCLTQRAVQAMQTVAIRLARERAGEDPDPSLAYGCVDWFRYDATSAPQEVDPMASPLAVRPSDGRSLSVQ